MSNVIQLHKAAIKPSSLQKRSDHIAIQAAGVVRASNPSMWKCSVDRALVLEAMITGDLWGGSMFQPLESGLSPFALLAALIFSQSEMEDITCYFTLVTDTPEYVIDQVIQNGMPIAEKLAGGAA